MSKKNLFRWLKIILMIYGLAGIALFYLQDRLFLHPVPLPPGSHYFFSVPASEINIPYNASSSISIVQFKTRKPPRGVVLYYHGNRDNISWYAHYASNFTRQGYEAWMVDYPGFGKSTGVFSEASVYAFADQLYKLAAARFLADSIIIYGKSLGTSAATRVAAQHPCRALILETPYYSFTALAAHFFPVYPVDKMIHYKFPTYDYLPSVKAPVTILQGTADWIVPYSNAERLREKMKPADAWIAIPGGSHNDLNKYPRFHEALDSVLMADGR